MKLSWTAATDDVGVQDYELTQDGEWLATVAESPGTDVANLRTLYPSNCGLERSFVGKSPNQSDR